MKKITSSALLFPLFLAACSSENVPQAHKGRMFDKTGALAFYAGGRGFEGPILGPGTYYTGVYPEVRMVDCTRRTIKEPLSALAKDSIQFSLDIFVSYSANCDDESAVKWLLSDLAPLGASAQSAEQEKEKTLPTEEKDPVEQNPDLTITSRQIYNTYIRPALGEAVRRTVAEYNANDINQKREEMFKKITDGFNADLASGASKKDESDPKAPKAVVLVTVYSLNLSNFAFPKEMADANTDRATQAVLRDTAIAARERVKAETETAQLRITQTETEAKAEAAKIDVIGAALHRNPEYYVRDVYAYAAEKGGSVMLPGNPNTIIQITPKKP